MAKKSDPFDKFREATLGGGNTLSGALNGAGTQDERQPENSPTPEKVSKNAERKLVSFHIDKDLHLKLGQLKYDTGLKYDELYTEAVTDLLVKYGRKL
jgi:hypothetical protein